MKKNSSFQPLMNFIETNISNNMGANDTPITTRSVITDYFDCRLNNRTITNNRLFLIVRRIAGECETAYQNHQSTFNVHFSSPTIDSQTLNNIKDFHDELAKELFSDGRITWTRIITFISFSALLAERIIQQQQQLDIAARNLIISSIIDCTTNFIDTEFQTWLQSQNYWSGCLQFYDRTPQRRNSIGRYAGILGLGMLTLGAFYMRRT